ncbi:DUF4411 family protein [Christiangramia sp. OXR-203]|jgi:hypothetical protein|uniref:DUF4411 family protein n=1 Tax=Christiangramia sp. OXR-203 TaxID=3100176 RepID=UPI002AC8D56C|nr:DUF4411 family protein [Christiangramia sp. OXR-203]WPY97660.1 DUF4411 family protein [Christiangramia sp. OXR-203]
MKKYLLDSNFFIQAHRSIYPLDIVPSFWNKTQDLASRGIIVSLDKVKTEIYDNSSHEDDLKDWCTANLDVNFFESSEQVLSNYIRIVQWVNSMSNHFNERAIQEFLETDLADPWLVAYAMENDLTIVTYEVSQPDRKNRVKIPEVCNQFGVEYVDTIKMMRELQESF